MIIFVADIETITLFQVMKTSHLCIIAILTIYALLPISVSAQNGHPADFHERYTLKEVVVLSRHNIRSPISGKRSTLMRITPHKWFMWSSAPGELSLRGGVLETMMGQYFRKWLVNEGLIDEHEIPEESAIRFYANSLQRTVATAQFFSSGMLPLANIHIERHCDIGRMDPVFNPQLTQVDEKFRADAMKQFEAMGGENGLNGISEKMSENFRLLEEVLDMSQSEACRNGDTCCFHTDDLIIHLVQNREPALGGSFRLACQAADALVLQYYEEADDLKASFGDTLTTNEWMKISEIKDWYGDVLFTAPIVARQVARPLLQTILDELQKDDRKFSFLCGHDSNIGSVLAALNVEEYLLPQTIERKTPIGAKLVIEKWEDKEGQNFTCVRLVYQSTEQLRQMSLLDLDNPPVSFPIRFNGLEPNADGLVPLEAFLQHIETVINN